MCLNYWGDEIEENKLDGRVALEIILNFFHKHNSEFIICGDINMNYLESNNKKNQLDNLLGTYNVIDIVFSPQE